METKILLIKSFIKSAINTANHSSKNIFDILINNIESHVEGKNAHNMTELRELANNKKKKGDLFEAFCYLYVKNILKHDEVWFYCDSDSELKEELDLNTTQDFGIDIISCKNITTRRKQYFAIQCKYRKPKDQIQTVSWKELSTFYGIVNKTGPWERHITMTNVNGCRHIGEKTEKDWSICIGTYRRLDNFKWLALIEEDGHVILNIKKNNIITKTTNTNTKTTNTNTKTTNTNTKTSNTKTSNTKTSNTKTSLIPDLEELRKKRLEYYENND
jgi:hypothetical protein